MKLAIHQQIGTFSDRWVQYCDSNRIPYVVVDCYASDIIQHLEGVDCLLWHWHLADQGSLIFAKGLTAAIEQMVSNGRIQ